jgi:hypothetical protein
LRKICEQSHGLNDYIRELRNKEKKMTTSNVRTRAGSLTQLRDALTGRVIGPDDAGYDDARTVFLGGIDRRPAVTVRVADATDVSRVVSLAREIGLEGLATPIVNMVQPMPYPEIFPPDDPNYHPVAVARTMFVDAIDGRVAETIVDHLRASTAPMAVAQLRLLGGAMARVPAEATAFAHRGRRIIVNVAAVYERRDEQAAHTAWVTAFSAALRQGDASAYVNFLGDEGEARVHEAYPGATWNRLAAIKRRYDPTNLFRLNQNISPAIEGRHVA